ncbi:probable LRR receptor-like serine/threonine-protein kinase At3g47570 isoform X2 [Panicum virgatum]|uniref:probable LRR receptor-like serine/threonine-protein kinase At3g47570 isoform X2 n=1 Tax=Panicum virgatum TaxID=38727 RepID=UPI0019D5ACA6|nr:probable LRR receptor-like serine/threonine-protein kinase At3g47570 isoform X2 [Panicum virgatum]
MPLIIYVKRNTDIHESEDNRTFSAMVGAESFMLVPLFLLLVLASTTSASISGIATSNASDHLALLSFKSLIRTDPSQALESWGNQFIPLCQWYGVTCGIRGRRRGRVTALDLENLSLVGTISSSVANLTFLKRLYLNSNRFSGTVPTVLGHLLNLRQLNLTDNSLDGMIPASLSNCSHLEDISLEFNNLKGKIPGELGALPNLRSILLFQNELEGEMPHELGSLHNLEALNLGHNKITGIIPQEICNLVNLRFLHIGNNKLTGEIPTGIGNLFKLSKLSLSTNQLTGSIPSSLGNLSALTVLTLHTNNLTGSIPPLQSLSSLRVLELGVNDLSGCIPSQLGNLTSLVFIDLQENHLTGGIPESLGNLNLLETLDLSFNNLTGSIPNSIGNLLSLSELDLNNNQLEGAVPPLLFNLSYLEVFDVQSNYYLNGSFPVDMGNNLPNLELFLIDYNQFHGLIPPSLCNSSMLQRIETVDNLLTGTIPNCLGIHLKRLSSLTFAKNQIQATQDADWDFLASLTNCSELQQLDLGDNLFAGEIPCSIGNLSRSLEYLNMEYNSITGIVPEEISNLVNLSTLHLYGNHLQELGNLKNLGTLDFSGNQISGEIPISLGECHMLQYLNASHNNLQGTIPLSVEQMKGLLVIDLSYNNLSGDIPEFLANMNDLSAFNLSFNNFKGQVPKDGIFRNASSAMIIGNNGLCGGIPQLKLPPCSSKNAKKPSFRLIIAMSIGSVCLFGMFTMFVSFIWKKKTKMNLQTSTISEQHMRISYAELAHATDSFSSGNLIGVGNFGSVFKGQLMINELHMTVAVKVLNLQQHGASQSFAAECETLRCARHRNLVKILTVCSSVDFRGIDFKALVFEFLPNGNLDHWLHQPIEGDGEHKMLDLVQRLGISIDVASALEYLHQHKPLPIIHGDLKPSNILLDDDLVAHIGDFGLARFYHQDSMDSPEVSSAWARMRGTTGYAAPEYGLGNKVSAQGDVYSYGILLLEMFTRKKPTDSEFGEDFSLHTYVKMAVPDQVANIVDTYLLQEEDGDEGLTSDCDRTKDIRNACITSILRVGISCSKETPTNRVQIGDALKELQRIRDRFLRDSNQGAPGH